jgi:hypothetical protein
MMQQAVHVVISRMSFSGEKCFGNEAKWKEKNVGGRYIIINTCVLNDNTLPSIVPAFGRVNVIEINFQILNYSYKILN